MTAIDLPARTSAPLARQLLAETRWVLRRPRNLLALLMLAALPVLLGTAIALTAGPGGRGGPSVLSAVAGNGLVLPVAAIMLAQSLLLPLVVAMVAADALAGESAHGTLRGLLLAPVGRVRLVGVKAFGVLVLAVLAVSVVAISGVLTGLIVVGGGDLVTLSGTTVSFGSALGRVALAVAWTAVQMAAVGAIALALSSLTEHPLVVVVATMGGLITFGVLGTIPALDWLQPVLITTDWSAVLDVLRDPVGWEAMTTGLLRAGCYLVIGLSATVVRMVTKDA
ncbi:ABC-2 type transport system permease protein [Saccharopolyspora antimicrobica]|uniref:ABC-2 type transport system permease protein n=2 Tax=Saccharopolyspora TaxID=1835 RepID=A0A1I4TKI7_9PSEU|nr:MULTISPECIES: ABC transporter permease [Saccharopolyspora]RKT88451.1 ABC-2 type transport system permease protein [Saccharopolyspora antimicrobica]SEG18304.1 ABC-2 type transport system permease protein [Saccharopolyspora kobensis]SFF09115.1 ABC-2 type transport system permease protein [Saccharopolyspora kobensis]SFM77242.1 ABC-2 type transport system permease protein [Saccharopolyspora antimicrobica]